MLVSACLVLLLATGARQIGGLGHTPPLASRWCPVVAPPMHCCLQIACSRGLL